MNTTIIITGIMALCSIICAIVTILTVTRNKGKDCKENGEQTGNMLSELGFIKSGVEDIKGQLRRHDDIFMRMSERVTAVEESAKQAHLRINRMEENKHE